MTTPPTQPSITKITLVQDDFYRLTLFPGGEGEVSYPMTWEQLFNLMNQIFEHGSSLPKTAEKPLALDMGMNRRQSLLALDVVSSPCAI